MAELRFNLSRLEDRLLTLFESSAARLFPFGYNEKDLASRLLEAMQENVHPHSDGSTWAPNLFILVAHPNQAQALKGNQVLTEEFARLIHQAGLEAGLYFASPPAIQIVPDDDVPINAIRIQATYNLESLSPTSVLESKPESDSETRASSAYLIINGSETFPINMPLVNIGRSSENQLVLEDLRISRKHAQLRYINGHFVIFDLNSSGGTYVNGQRIVQSVLYTGDVISLAGLPLIFSYENFNPLGETQPLQPAPP